MDSGMNGLLKWSLDAQAPKSADEAAAESNTAAAPPRGFDSEALARLLGGPSEADLMRQAMAAIESPEVDLENKLVAFDNFEQLIENLDNANNMINLKLWEPMVNQLKNDEDELRRMAAWCIGTAVQNNIKSQEKVSLRRSHHNIPSNTSVVPRSRSHPTSRLHVRLIQIQSYEEKGRLCSFVFRSQLPTRAGRHGSRTSHRVQRRG
jgi:hypothetical protein